MAEQELPSFRRKIIRADEHLKTVLEVLAACAEGECLMVPEQDLDKNIGFLRVRLSKTPDCLSPMIGDFLFNARAALDHLIWQLVERTPERRHADQNMFPICSSRNAFDGQVKRRRLDGLPEKAATLVESLQPYHGGNNPLRRLADLHELDKHRMLSLTTAVAKDTQVVWSSDSEAFFHMFIGGEELRDGAVFGDFGFTLGHPDYPAIAARFGNVKVQGQAAIFIAFQESGVEELEPFRVDRTLCGISEFIRETVFPRFEPFLN